jgi:tyrosyl-tRNA synthetase
MGKTAEGSTIWLNPQKTKPFDFFQFWRQLSDPKAEEMLFKLTFLPCEDIKEQSKAHSLEPQLGMLQETLAFELTKFVHGSQTANTTREVSRIFFGKTEVTEDNIALLAQEIPPIPVPHTSDETTMLATVLGLSKSQVRRDMPGIKTQTFGNIILVRKGKKKIALAQLC